MMLLWMLMMKMMMMMMTEGVGAMIILRASTPGHESSPTMKTWPASKFGQHTITLLESDAGGEEEDYDEDGDDDGDDGDDDGDGDDGDQSTHPPSILAACPQLPSLLITNCTHCHYCQ